MYSPQLPLARGRVPSSYPSSSFSFDAQHADPGGLEAALLQIMHDHHHTSLKLRDQAGLSKNIYMFFLYLSKKYIYIYIVSLS